jgi:hypothetical protein
MSQEERLAQFGLEKLSDAGLTLADPSQDIRGRKIVDRQGEQIGHVSDLFIDEERKVRMMEVRAGGFLGLGDRHFLLPIETVLSATAGEVIVGATREHIVGAPVYDPRLVERPTSASLQSHYDHYGVNPRWSTGSPSAESPTQQF